MESELTVTPDNAANKSNVTVIMPIGGLATRARELTHDAIPKHLIRLGNGKTVLDTITHGLQRVGFMDFVFCLGYLSDQLVEHIEGGGWQIKSETRYRFSFEESPLGPDGAIMQAIGRLGIQGQAMIIPGDLMLPWQAVADMNETHAKQGTDITVGVTSHITPRTTDVGKIIGENGTNRLLWCYPRTAPEPPLMPGAQNLTSAAATVISVERYQELCQAYVANFPNAASYPLSLRDQVMSWVSATHPNFDVKVFDIKGEILDLGTPDNIHFGQDNWSLYV